LTHLLRFLGKIVGETSKLDGYDVTSLYSGEGSRETTLECLKNKKMKFFAKTWLITTTHYSFDA
jgi:hypothetical protein